jgi:hypothetical protein
MEFEAPLDAFAREQRAGLGALARMSRPDDWDPPDFGVWDPPWDPPGSGDWDPPLAPRPYVRDWPAAEEPGLPGVRSRSLRP